MAEEILIEKSDYLLARLIHLSFDYLFAGSMQQRLLTMSLQ